MILYGSLFTIGCSTTLLPGVLANTMQTSITDAIVFLRQSFAANTAIMTAGLMPVGSQPSGSFAA